MQNPRGNHERLLYGIFGRAAVVQDEVGEAQHRVGVGTQQTLEVS